MPTKTKQTTKKKNADIQERAKWRWEFLRRGEVYIRAYERFKHKYQGWILCGLDPSWLATESLMHALGVDPKVVADHMGHNVDVNQNVYTQTSLERRREAVKILEEAFAASLTR